MHLLLLLPPLWRYFQLCRCIFFCFCRHFGDTFGCTDASSFASVATLKILSAAQMHLLFLLLALWRCFLSINCSFTAGNLLIADTSFEDSTKNLYCNRFHSCADSLQAFSWIISVSVMVKKTPGISMLGVLYCVYKMMLISKGLLSPTEAYKPLRREAIPARSPLHFGRC